jgi:hypothetical protein
MTALVARVREMRTAFHAATVVPTMTVRAAAVKTRLAEIWPLMLVVFGLAITFVWCSSLLWLFVWCVFRLPT